MNPDGTWPAFCEYIHLYVYIKIVWFFELHTWAVHRSHFCSFPLAAASSFLAALHLLWSSLCIQLCPRPLPNSLSLIYYGYMCMYIYIYEWLDNLCENLFMQVTDSPSHSSHMLQKYISNKNLTKLLIFDNWSTIDSVIRFEQLCVLHNNSSNPLS